MAVSHSSHHRREQPRGRRAEEEQWSEQYIPNPNAKQPRCPQAKPTFVHQDRSLSSPLHRTTPLPNLVDSLITLGRCPSHSSLHHKLPRKSRVLHRRRGALLISHEVGLPATTSRSQSLSLSLSLEWMGNGEKTYTSSSSGFGFGLLREPRGLPLREIVSSQVNNNTDPTTGRTSSWARAPGFPAPPSPSSPSPS